MKFPILSLRDFWAISFRHWEQNKTKQKRKKRFKQRKGGTTRKGNKVGDEEKKGLQPKKSQKKIGLSVQIKKKRFEFKNKILLPDQALKESLHQQQIAIQNHCTNEKKMKVLRYLSCQRGFSFGFYKSVTPKFENDWEGGKKYARIPLVLVGTKPKGSGVFLLFPPLYRFSNKENVNKLFVEKRKYISFFV